MVNCFCSRSFLQKTNLQDSFTSVFLPSVAPGLCIFWKYVLFLKACPFLKMVTSVVTGGKVGNPEGSASLLPWTGFLCRLGELDLTRESRKSTDFFSLKLFPLLASSPHLSFSYLFLSPRLHIMYFFSQMHSNGVADTLKWIATPI